MKPGWVECTGEYDGLVWDIRQIKRRVDHGIRTMRDQNMRGFAARHFSVDQLPVLFGEMQAVFAHQGLDLKIKSHLQLFQYLPNLRVANLVVTHIVKVNFVDRSARGYD